MRRKGEFAGWVIVGVVVGVVVGWWLAVRSFASRAVSAVAEVVEPLQLDGASGQVKTPLAKRSNDYLTLRELAAYLNVSTKTVHREIKAGKLPSVRMRNKVTVQGSDALAWLSARKEG